MDVRGIPDTTQSQAKGMAHSYVAVGSPPEAHPNGTPSHSSDTSHHTYTTGPPLHHRWIMVPRWTLWRVHSCCMHPYILVHTDTLEPLKLQGCFTGITYWSLMYGCPEHRRYLTCINQDQHRTFTPHAVVMQHVFRAIFASLAMPVVEVHQDYRIPMQPLTASTWQVNWFA